MPHSHLSRASWPSEQATWQRWSCRRLYSRRIPGTHGGSAKAARPTATSWCLEVPIQQASHAFDAGADKHSMEKGLRSWFNSDVRSYTKQLYKGWHCGVLLSRRELEVQGTRYRYKVQVQGTRHTVLGTRCTEYPWACSLILWGCSKLALPTTPIFQSPRRTEAQRPSIHVATLKYRGLSRFTRWLSRRQPTLKTSTQVFQGLAALFARHVSFRRPPGSHGWPTTRGVSFGLRD